MRPGLGLLLLAVWVFLTGAPSMPFAQSLAQVTGFRFGEQGTRTRVVLDADRPLAYSTQALGDPWRLVIDLPQVVWNPQPGPLSGTRGIARGHRFGSLGAGKGQFVIDTARPFRVVNAVLLPPSADSKLYRLTIDIEPDNDVAMAGIAPPAELPLATPPAPSVQVAALPSAVLGERPVTTDTPPLPRVMPRPTPTVIIDAGHGGSDPGAIGISGIYEKELTLAMARQLRDLLHASGRYRVVLTRDGDLYVPLRERIHLAREAGGSLFISLHADAQARQSTRGASVYTLSETASDSEAGLLASKENKADIITGTDLRNHDAMVASILIDLAQRDTNNKSIEFADILSAELAGVAPLLRKHRRFAGFAVLKSPDMPSALVELGYLSNPEDEKNLTDVAYRAKLSAAVLRAVDRYFADIKS